MWLIRLRLLLKSVGREGLVLLYALRHPETPRGIRLGILGLLLYVISPFDLVPDFLLLLGWADDAAVILMGVPFLVRRLPARVLADCSEAAGRLLARFGFRA
ncbi:MAG: DUF1232 domain-containing protein [Burkholderiaceae bacterium]